MSGLMRPNGLRINRATAAGLQLYKRLASIAPILLLAASTVPLAMGQQAAAAPKIKAAAIQVTMTDSPQIKLPAAFQVSLYEDLINQLRTKSGLKVYREGEKSADGASDLIALRTTMRIFKEGSERVRQVTTVAGATSITVHCTFTSKDGKTLLEQDIQGKVRFFGANLRATYDFAKKTAQVTRDHFSPTGTPST
jgi:hypothetical protein